MESVQVKEINNNNNIQYSTTLPLPVGFRFCPKDEELILDFLCNKICNRPLPCDNIIKEVNLYACNPEELIARFGANGEKEWFFFTLRDRKYPKGSRPNRAAGYGYWKATGADKAIISNGKQVGLRKALVFYIGKPPNGDKSMWIMQEFRVRETLNKHRERDSTNMKLDDWVLCRIYKKPSSNRTPREDEHPKTTEMMARDEENLPLINQVDTPQVNECNQMPQTISPGESLELTNFPSETILNPMYPLNTGYSSNSWDSNQGGLFNNHLDNTMRMGYGMYDQYFTSEPCFPDETNIMDNKYTPNPLNMSYHLPSQFNAHGTNIFDQYNAKFEDEATYINQKRCTPNPLNMSYHLPSQFDAHGTNIFDQCNAKFEDEVTYMNLKCSTPNPLNMSYHLPSQFDAHGTNIFYQYNAKFEDEATDMNQKCRNDFDRNPNQ